MLNIMLAGILVSSIDVKQPIILYHFPLLSNPEPGTVLTVQSIDYTVPGFVSQLCSVFPSDVMQESQ